MKSLGSTDLNDGEATSPFVRLVQEDKMWETSHHLQDVLPQNWGGTEVKRIVLCMVLKVTANDRHRALLVKLLYQNDNSTIVALRKFRTLKGLRKGPLTAKNLRLMVTKFEETKSLNVRSGRGKKPVSAEAIEKVALQKVVYRVDLHRSTVQKIMRNILRYYPYKLQFVQELLPHDFETQHLFSLQFLARLKIDPEWPWNILWTDEAHFLLDGAGGPVTCSITGQRYASLLRNKIIPDLQARQCLSRIIFMQDGAPPHSTRCVKHVLKHHFTEERVISRHFRHLWPPRSPDLNPCDFWPWSHLKQLVSCEEPKTLPDLKDSISRHVLSISQNTLRSTVEHAILRFQIVAENDGHHVEHLLL
ncbi:uncharacterized protein TNCV_1471921 [Trichonephila clavipes]|nr:uncharacterized protein TNCV_1471921 [Trichonephila clavipes]